MKKYKKFQSISRVFFLAVISLLMLRCTPQSPTGDGADSNPQQLKFDTDMDALKGKNDSTTKAIRALDMGGLLERLSADAKVLREPFNSPAYREMVTNRKDKGPDLLADIQKRQDANLLNLLALREIAPQSYQTLDTALRTKVLVGTLAGSIYFNLWGLPHLYWEDAAKAVVEIGAPAKPSLKALLDDTSDAPMYGSEEVAEYLDYKYRRCDYALALLMAIRGESALKLPKSPEERDRLIEAERTL